ncbi:MAG: MFS transporter [Chloroflexi bacterium]|nr:MFS transporter [Chloroflexota bacterium]
MHKIKGSFRQCLFSSTLGFFIGLAAVALFGPTAQKFKQVMDLSPVQVGFLVSMPALSGSLLRIPFGAWTDGNGGRKPFILLLVLAFFGMAALFIVVSLLYPDSLTSAHYPLLLLTGVLCGCGIATFSVGIGQVSYWCKQGKQGTALGIYGGLANMAPGIFSLVLPYSLVGWGLPGTYLAWLIFLAMGIAAYVITGQNACYFQLRDRKVPHNEALETSRRFGQDIFPSGNTFRGLVAASRIWKTWVLVAIYFATFGGFIALTAWLPTYWMSFFGHSLARAGALTALYSILTSVFRVAGGSMSDRIGGEKTLMFSLAVFLAGSALMTLSHDSSFSVAGLVVMAFGMGIANAAVFKIVPQVAKQSVGGTAGWVGGIGAFGGFALPPLMALAVRLWGLDGYATGFTIFVAISLVSLLLGYLLMRVQRVPGPATAGTLNPGAGYAKAKVGPADLQRH